MYKTLSGKEIILSKKIAKGGEGEVFEIAGNGINTASPWKSTSDTNNCVKIYYDHIRSKEKEEKIKYMVLNPPSDLQGITYKICWPKDVIYKKGEFVGFLMPKAFNDSLLPYHLCQPLIPKKLSSQWHATFDRKTFKGITSRLKLSVNIVAIVNRIHSTNKYIIVDLKPQNLLITAFGKVSIIDMDSVQIAQKGKVLFKAPVSTPEYTPSEASDIIKSKSPISKDWDVFSLGVLVYEILCGIHPYVGSAKPPFESLNTIQEKIKVNLTHITKGESAFSVLPPLHKSFYDYNSDLINIFKKIFSPYILNASERPSLEDFGGTLFNAVALLEVELEKEEKKRLKQEKIKKKLEEKEALKNYKNLKNDYRIAINKLAIHKSDNSSLRKQVEETKNRSKLLAPVLVILLLIFMGLFIGEYSSNYSLLKEYNLLMDDYNIEVKNYKSEIEEYKSEIDNVKLKFSPISISEITFNSQSEKNSYGFKSKKTNLPRSKTYYLYPKIKYNGKLNQTLSLYIKYFTPNSDLETYSESPDGYTLKAKIYLPRGNKRVELEGYGNEDGNWLDVGQNKIEIWLDGVKLYQQYFTVTDN